MTRSVLAIAQMVLLVSIVAVATDTLAIQETASSPQSPNVCEDGVQTSLDGLIVLRKEYGPPGWGEDPAQDSRWTMVVLQPTAGSQKQVKRLMSSCTSDPKAFSQVQLWIPDKAGSAKEFNHSRVHVKGHLYPANGPPAEILTLQLDASRIQKY